MKIMLIPKVDNTWIYLLIGIFSFGGICPTVYAQISPQLVVPAKDTNLFTQGLIKLNQAFYREAIADFTQVIQQQPSFAEAYYYRGLAYAVYAQGKPPAPGAESPSCQRVNNYVVYCNVAEESRWIEQSQQQAIADFTQAIQLNPQFAAAYYQRAFRQKSQTQKLVDLKQASALYLSQGCVDLDQGYYEKSAREFELMNKLDRLITSLETISLTGRKEAGGTLGSSSIPSQESPQEVFSEANDLLGRGDIQGAIAKFQIAENLFKISNNTKKYQEVHQIIGRLEKISSR